MNDGHYENKAALVVESVNDSIISDDDFSVSELGKLGNATAQGGQLGKIERG